MPQQHTCCVARVIDMATGFMRGMALQGQLQQPAGNPATALVPMETHSFFSVTMLNLCPLSSSCRQVGVTQGQQQQQKQQHHHQPWCQHKHKHKQQHQHSRGLCIFPPVRRTRLCMFQSPGYHHDHLDNISTAPATAPAQHQHSISTASAGPAFSAMSPARHCREAML